MNETASQLKNEVQPPLKLRDLLEEMAIKELLGPVGGPDEEVDERIRDRYLGLIQMNKGIGGISAIAISHPPLLHEHGGMEPSI